MTVADADSLDPSLLSSLHFFDAHCHPFDIPSFTPLPTFSYAVVGYSPESCEKVLSFSQPQFARVVGIAPQTVVREPEASRAFLPRLESVRHTIHAIGEIGLDYKWAITPSQRKAQEQMFRAQLSLAERERLPVVIHSRRAESVCLDILSEYSSLSVLLHSFCGNDREVERACELGYFFSVNERTAPSILDTVPLVRLLLESDAPYISPTSERILSVAHRIAHCKNASFSTVVETTTNNAMKFFRISDRELQVQS